MTNRIRGNVDRYWVDPATGAHVLAGWVTDDADPNLRSLVVRFIEDGAVVGQAVADLPRDDGYHGYVVQCDGSSLAARAVGGGLAAVAQAPDGAEGSLHWYEPFVETLRGLFRADDRATPGVVTAIRPLPDGIEVSAGAVHLRIVAVQADIIRTRMAAQPDWTDDISWVVVDAVRQASVAVRPLREYDFVGFATTRLIVRVARATGRVMITAADGAPVCMDALSLPCAVQGGGFTIHKQHLAGERFFGLGDQPGPLDRTGRAFTLWNTDAGWYQDSSTPLYKSIPFFLGVRPGGACGILLDNSWRSHFDFARARRDVVSFGAEGGACDYYVLHGADAGAVLQAYARLTGPPPLPPLWAFGYQQSRYSYMTQEAVLAVADGLRSRRFPADVIYCDIDYQDRHRPFTVNTETFPDFAGMVGALAERNFRTVVITDLHIARVEADYAPYQTGLAGDHFVHDPAEAPYVGESWPGAAVFPDFTRADTRAWWGTLYRGFVDAGVAGFWNDMNEPSVHSEPTKTMPLDTVHRVAEPDYPYRSATHAELHNVVGQQNARATYEALQAMRADERPFVLTRASFAGGQRYGWSWTGDNSATWHHLRLTTPMLVNAGLSGLAFIGADVGGFFGAPAPALLTRWFQVAAFHPLFRNHCVTEAPPREPWLDGPEHEAIRRRFVEARYQLLPYIYTVAEEASRTGLPMLRPLFLECPSALGADSMYDKEPEAQFMLGGALMVAPPPFGEMLSAYGAVLPEGPWYDYWTGRRVDDPVVRVQPSLAHLPVFVRAGSIVPRQAVVQSTQETPDGPLELAVYPGERCTGSIYADDGHSLAYRRGAFLRQSFAFTGDAAAAEFRLLAREGSHAPWWTAIELVIHGMPDRPVDVVCHGASLLGCQYDHERQALRVVVSDPAGEGSVTVRTVV